jgi:hypothetical protein
MTGKRVFYSNNGKNLCGSVVAEYCENGSTVYLIDKFDEGESIDVVPVSEIDWKKTVQSVFLKYKA